MKRVVIRLGQVERVIGGIVMDEVRTVVVTMLVVVIVVVVRVVLMVVIVVVVIVVVVMLERDEIVRMLVIAARVRVRDDARAGHRRRRDEGREDGLDDGWAETQRGGPTTSPTVAGKASDAAVLTGRRAACHLL